MANHHFYVIGQERYRIQRITQKIAIMPFKVTDFGTNWKPICDFVLVINSNLPPILRHFQVMADYWLNFCYR